jgi:P-type Mg2+ transporter
VLLPFTPLGRWFGFLPLPTTFLLAIGGLVAVYLLLAQVVKSMFYRLQRSRGLAPPVHLHPHLPLVGHR